MGALIGAGGIVGGAVLISNKIKYDKAFASNGDRLSYYLKKEQNSFIKLKSDIDDIEKKKRLLMEEFEGNKSLDEEKKEAINEKLCELEEKLKVKLDELENFKSKYNIFLDEEKEEKENEEFDEASDRAIDLKQDIWKIVKKLDFLHKELEENENLKQLQRKFYDSKYWELTEILLAKVDEQERISLGWGEEPCGEEEEVDRFIESVKEECFSDKFNREEEEEDISESIWE